jgi:hypothetical protein
MDVLDTFLVTILAGLPGALFTFAYERQTRIARAAVSDRIMRWSGRSPDPRAWDAAGGTGGTGLGCGPGTLPRGPDSGLPLAGSPRGHLGSCQAHPGEKRCPAPEMRGPRRQITAFLAVFKDLRNCDDTGFHSICEHDAGSPGRLGVTTEVTSSAQHSRGQLGAPVDLGGGADIGSARRAGLAAAGLEAAAGAIAGFVYTR